MKTLVIGLALLFSACSSGSSGSNSVVGSHGATSVKDSSGPAVHELFVAAAKELGDNMETKDFSLKCADRLPVRPGDKANGVDQKWCVVIRAAGRWKDTPPMGSNQSNPWLNLRLPLLAQQKSGTWTFVVKTDPMACDCEGPDLD